MRLSRQPIPQPASPEIGPGLIYTPKMHAANLAKAEAYVNTLGCETDAGHTTGWMVTQGGLARVRCLNDNYTGEFVEAIPDGKELLLPAHFVKHTIDLGRESVMGRTEAILPLRHAVGIRFLQSPLSERVLMSFYPAVDSSPIIASSVLVRHLNDPHRQSMAFAGNLSGLFSKRYFTLRHRVGVKLEEG